MKVCPDDTLASETRTFKKQPIDDTAELAI